VPLNIRFEWEGKRRNMKRMTDSSFTYQLSMNIC